MQSPYMDILILQERLSALWNRLRPERAAEFANEPPLADDVVTFAYDLAQVESLAGAPHVVEFDARSSTMRDSRRRELLGLTALGRAVLQDEEAAATFASESEDIRDARRDAAARGVAVVQSANGRLVLGATQPARPAVPLSAKETRRRELLAASPLGRLVLEDILAAERSAQ